MKIKTIDRHFYMKLAEKLNDIRISKCKTFREMSEDTGLSRTALDNFFLGRTKANDEKFDLICDSLEVNPSAVINSVFYQ